MPTKDPVLDWIADIARLGRTAKMHLVLGLQRPDASIMGGELRDNFGCRISLGKLKSKEASMMMWDDPAIGLSVPDVPGRAVSVIEGAPAMVQGTFTANPDPNHDDYHRNMVAAMRPEVGRIAEMAIATPVPDEESKTGELTWIDIIAALLLVKLVKKSSSIRSPAKSRRRCDSARRLLRPLKRARTSNAPIHLQMR